MKGTLPPGPQTRQQETALVPSYLPEDKHVQYGLRIEHFNVDLEPLQQKKLLVFVSECCFGKVLKLKL